MQTILICDDEKDIVSALEIYLRADGYKTFSAANGAEALEILSQEEIHLVLMDIMMPKMQPSTMNSSIRIFLILARAISSWPTRLRPCHSPRDFA